MLTCRYLRCGSVSMIRSSGKRGFELAGFVRIVTVRMIGLSRVVTILDVYDGLDCRSATDTRQLVELLQLTRS
jgi:hypothetical protein